MPATFQWQRGARHWREFGDRESDVSRSVRINAICPGWVRTPPVENWMKRDPKIARQILAQEPIRRLGTPEEIAETVIWLCSERASFVVGAALAIDGGYLA